MLIKFKGDKTVSQRTYSGCSSCGTGRSVNGTEEYRTSYRMYYNGRLMRFEKDVPVEVDEIAGKYLLSRTYKDNGKTVHSFEEVKE